MLTKVLLIDDHPLFAQGLAMMVKQARPDWQVSCEFSAAAGLARLAEDAEIALVIVDLNLPDLDGFETLQRAAAIRPDIPRLVLTGRVDSIAQLRAQQAGARSFIIKTATPDEILGQLEDALRNDTMPAAIAPAQRLPTLTVRQAEVLTLLSEGCANKEIRARLEIAERTVRAHLTDLFQLLGVNSRVQALLQARRLGLID